MQMGRRACPPLVVGGGRERGGGRDGLVIKIMVAVGNQMYETL